MFALPNSLKSLFQAPTDVAQPQQQKSVSIPIARPVAISRAQQTPSTKQIIYDLEEKAFGQLPRRIRRIYNLSREGGYTKGSQIEGVHLTGLWAKKFVKLYEQVDQTKKHMLETKTMEQIFVLVNNLIDKGAI